MILSLCQKCHSFLVASPLMKLHRRRNFDVGCVFELAPKVEMEHALNAIKYSKVFILQINSSAGYRMVICQKYNEFQIYHILPKPRSFITIKLDQSEWQKFRLARVLIEPNETNYFESMEFSYRHGQSLPPLALTCY